MKVQRTPRQIAPWLANRDSRISNRHYLPEAIKEGLQAIAMQENQSASWVIEQVLIEYFHLRQPRYQVTRETKPPRRHRFQLVRRRA